jgi:GTPase SAR1 family protein
VELHDSPKRQRFLTDTGNLSNLYRSSNAVLLVYDVNDMTTFANLNLWMKECQEYIWGNTGHQLVWAVVGNKSDFLSEVSLDAVEEFMKEINASIFFEVSALTGEKVDEMFLKIIEEVHERKLRTTINRDNHIKLDSGNVSNYKMNKTCCA